LEVAIDAQGRIIWASTTLECQTSCALFDPSCPSTTTTQFQEKWPELVGERAVRLDVFHSDNGIYDRMQEAIKETLKTVAEFAPLLAAF
jgi:hypothetical protein